MQPIIRPYGKQDLDAVYDICVRTGDNGLDARGHFSSDTLLGDVYAAPYVTLEPEHAHILDDGTGRAVGYIIGTADTERFVRRFRAEWLPVVAGRHPEGDPRDAGLLWRLHHPEQPTLPEYPAHLHIDLLPEAQGRGFGRRLMEAFLSGLRAAGVGGVHLGVSPDNKPARAFYDRLGFTPLDESGTTLVRRIA
ncbi:GNAT family N-acetyltransferase [Actinoplanes sp. TBRC 11911]|uniref:GNAT family N-acetyltransferase n=1 Tax=Actinoplanes sp. TBRC 11911 TaxID=2729386 RepID=UPI00145E5BF2|nr:N-acetyltransferase [Actinoplanes sp. TBRC 11911]NMO56738.1 GNAT family N-acetyltransferase [Actinoplanes sp. TBRC 11911]